MEEIWKRIEAWLRAHAPDYLADLQPGASDTAIARAEKSFGATLPDSVRASYRIHDGARGGMGPLIPPWRLLSLDNSVKRWKQLSQEHGSAQDDYTEPEAGIQAGWWRKGWIPVASNSSGDFLCVDLEPAPGGKRGQIILYWHADVRRGKLADDFESWLRQFADELEKGKYKLDGEWLARIE